MNHRHLLSRIEEGCENIFFRTRWALVPGYVVLIASLGLLVYKTVIGTWEMFLGVSALDENETVIRVLGIVDLVLVMNLVWMVVVVGYVNFVSKIHFNKSEDEPGWLHKLNYSGLKVQMMGSILAIASVKILRAYFSLGTQSAMPPSSLLWLVIIYGVFIVALVCVAVTDALHGRKQ